jgi:hypothetical protein
VGWIMQTYVVHQYELASQPETRMFRPKARPAIRTLRTTTLFAALNVLDGTVIGRNMQFHRHQEFTRFLDQVEATVPAGKLVHAVVDNYATHKHPKVHAWLVRHPR